MKYDVLIIGAGPAGAATAHLCAQKGYKCLVVEIGNHIAGNLYDSYNAYGIMVHRYGPHFFRTDKDHVWDFLSAFTDWHYYEHKVLSSVQGMLVPFPINVDTYNALYNTHLSSAEFAEALRAFHTYDVPQNAEESAINQVGEYLYELFIKNYTIKQWGNDPKNLHPDTIRRVKVRTDRESRYQPLKYQALPAAGYTQMIQNMLDHPRIHLMLNCNYREVIDHISYEHVICSAPLDYFFDFEYGELQYRSLRLEEKTFFKEHYQAAAVINYPNNYGFTRVTEYKHMTGQEHRFTTVHFEYPQDFVRGKNRAYYPILTERNLQLRERYMEKARALAHVSFFGRLAEYKYYAMDEIFEGAIELVRAL